MLTASAILDLADVGADSTSTRRAILIAAARGLSEAEIAMLPIGRLNALALEARRAALGDRMDSRVACPACAEPLEFALHAGELLAQAPAATGEDEQFELSSGDLSLVARLPTAADLLAVEHALDVPAARNELLRRCVVAAHICGDPVVIDALPEAAVAALGAEIQARDPLIETAVDLRCPACGYGWGAALDIAAFVWRELAALADRLAAEVDALARAYGWREQDILAMPARRRRRYLELI